jgi:hypothetical protein
MSKDKTRVSEMIEPICVDCWSTSENSTISDYQKAIDVAMENTNQYIEKNGTIHEQIIRHALMESITRQAMRTCGSRDFRTDSSMLSKSILDGTASYQHMVQTVVEYPEELASIELARLTHVGDTEACHTVDTDIRTLHERAVNTIDGDKSQSKARYKVRRMEEKAVVLERRKTQYHYLGKRAIVVACHSLLLDISNASMSRDIRKKAHELLEANRIKNAPGFHGDKTRHISSDFRDVLEKTLWEDEEFTGVIPLTTIYYAAYTHDSLLKTISRGPARFVDALLPSKDSHR